MDEKNMGGAAFPHMDQAWSMEEGRFHPPAAEGMSLRDYFAAKVLPAVLVELYSTDLLSHQIPVEAASIAYDLADAMLVERAA